MIPSKTSEVAKFYSDIAYYEYSQHNNADATYFFKKAIEIVSNPKLMPSGSEIFENYEKYKNILGLKVDSNPTIALMAYGNPVGVSSGIQPCELVTKQYF